MPRLLFHLRYSLRKFMRTPGLALALVLTIAVGIGSNVSVYAFGRGLTQSNSPLISMGRIVSIFAYDAHHEAAPFSYDDYRSLKRNLNLFEWIGAARVAPAGIAIANESSVASVAAVTSDLARALNLSIEEGVVISHRIWQKEFAAASNIRGEKIYVDGVKTKVSGVAPEWLEGLYRDRDIDVWMPFRNNTPRVHRSGSEFWVLGRLRPGASMKEAQKAIHLNRTAGAFLLLPYTGMTPEMAEAFSRVGILFGFAAGAVFLIACANVVAFLLARAFARSRETSIRTALGAERRALALELLSDSVVISVAGGALGALFAVWTSYVVPALLFDQDAERLIFAPDFISIATAAVICTAITILCALVPVFTRPNTQPAAVLRRESAGSSPTTARLRTGLVLGQMAGCTILVVATAFLLDGLHAALRTGTGSRLGEPILASVQAQPAAGIRYFQQVQQAVRSMSDISGVAWTERLPGDQPVWRSFRIEPAVLPRRDITMDTAWFTADSLKLFRLPPKAGRLFGFEDQACRVAIVNGVADQELFEGDAVGRMVQDGAGLPVEIIGVVEEKAGQTPAERRPTIYYNDTDQTRLAAVGTQHAHFRVPIPSEPHVADLEVNVVSQSYFTAMGISLTEGREFAGHRMASECRIAIVNRNAAGLYFGGRPVGAAVVDDQGVRTAIVGVVDSKPIAAFARHAEPAIYFPMLQDAPRRMTLIAAARHATDPILAGLRHRVEAVPGRGPAPVIVKTLAAHLARTALAPLRIATIVIGASAALALLLGVLGLFGALSDAALRRRRELAIRIALGAGRWRIVRLVLKEGVRLALAGALLGMLGSLALSPLLAHITRAESPPAVWVWLLAPLALTMAVLIASVLPARRALLANPITILRDEN